MECNGHIKELASGLHAAGFTTAPVKPDGTKETPIKWGPLMEQRIHPDAFANYFDRGHGLLLVCTKMYGRDGGLEVMCCDEAGVAKSYLEGVERRCPGLIARLPQISTPRDDGSVHLYFLSPERGRSTKLARDVDRSTLIEVKAYGGYVGTVGSPGACHPTGRTYRRVGGPRIEDVPLLTLEERAILYDEARLYHRHEDSIKPDADEEFVEPEIPEDDDRPGTHFGRTATWASILEPKKWVAVGESESVTYWRRPGKDTGHSATTGLKSRFGNELFYCFTSSDSVFDDAKHYTKFECFSLLFHDGDSAAAAAELRREGYGGSTQTKSEPKEDDGPAYTIEFREQTRSTTMVTVACDDDIVLVDAFNITKAGQREKFIEAVRKRDTDIDPAWLERVLVEKATYKPPPIDLGPREPVDPLARFTQAVKDAAAAMLADPDLLARIVDDAAIVGVAGEHDLVTAVYLTGTSRLLSRPLSLRVMGPTASGKSYVVEKTCLFFPREAILIATSLTTNALYYLEPGKLKHRLIVCGERSRLENDDTAEATRALREMQASRRLSKLVTVRCDGGMTTEHVEQEGPVAFIETTSMLSVFAEDSNRAVEVTTDEGPEQTQRILRKLAAQCGDDVDLGDAEFAINRHHALQLMLRQMPIVIPYRDRLADRFPPTRIEARRAFQHLLTTIQAVALLHQYQRQEDGDGRLIADLEDYRTARAILAGPMARSLGGQISDAAYRLYQQMGTLVGLFTAQEVARHSTFAVRSVQGWLNELHDAGAVELFESARGSKPAQWRMTGQPPSATGIGDCDLPTVEEVAGDG